jgi:phosphatidylglycerophosphate synthase
MEKIDQHKRKNDILLGPLERRALNWFAIHLPPWITPNICTLIGIGSAFLIMVSYALSMIDRNFLWLASLGFVLNWFGDSMDGTLARHRHIERPKFGFFIDHSTDAFCTMMIILGLGLSPYIRFGVACLLLIAYLLLSVLVYIRTCVVGEFRISYSKLGPTEFRLIGIGLNTVMYFATLSTFSVTIPLFGQIVLSPYDLVVLFLSFLLLFFFLSTTIGELIQLNKIDR